MVEPIKTTLLLTGGVALKEEKVTDHRPKAAAALAAAQPQEACP